MKKRTEKRKTGIIIICHGKLASELKKSAVRMSGDTGNVEAIDFPNSSTTAELKDKLAATIRDMSLYILG